MARKRNPPPDRCSHSPFKNLKGLSCPERSQPVAPPPLAPGPPAPADDDVDVFASAMASLAVRPLPDRNPVAGRNPEAAPVVPPSAGDAETVEFLAAVGRLDRNFRDELPAVEDTPRARPRRLKQLERGALQPAGELDLHGLCRDEALARTRTFLAHAVRQRWQAVLIVTGKGLHSGEEPVLRRAVVRLLDEMRALILEWGEAPRRYGGAGALVVFPRLSANKGEPREPGQP